MTRGSILLLAAAAALIISGGVYMYQQARGIRNNNPGNIRHGSNWQGMSEQQTDRAFVQFADPVWGIRALNRVLKTYAGKYHLDTVAKIISRWAPSNENDTSSYINAVAKVLDVAPNEPINVEARATELTMAIIYHENGQQPYAADVIAEGAVKGWA